jgi:predicted amidohydrolase
MATFKLSLVQMRCEPGALVENLAAHEAHIRQASQQGAGFVCFPEMSLTGYADPGRYPQAVLALDSPDVARFVGLTAGTSIVAMAGIVEANPAGKPFITQLVAQSGRLIGYYRKIRVEDEELGWYSPSPDGRIELFQANDLCFGMAICADIGDAGLFARLAELGARIIFVAAAPGLYGDRATRDWESGFRWWQGECLAKLGRTAGDLGLPIAVATQAGATRDEDFPGGGYLFGPNGDCLAATPDWSEGMLLAEVTIPATPDVACLGR